MHCELTCIPGGLPWPPPENLASKGLESDAARMPNPSTRELVDRSLQEVSGVSIQQLKPYLDGKVCDDLLDKLWLSL